MNDYNSPQEKLIGFTQMILRSESKENQTSPSFIYEKIKSAALLFTPKEQEQIDIEAAAKELVIRMSRWVPKDTTLIDTSNHVAWLTSERKKDWKYWSRLAMYLDRKQPAEVIDATDRSTDEILGALEDPKREGAWDRRGLVVGHVQSGKTSNYSALICKAADAGYKIIIVLAGLHNNLRAQTQIRLEETFLGYETSPTREPGRPIGVYWTTEDQSIKTHCGTTREEKGDFSAKHFAYTPEERPWLFVVKKHKRVLGSLLKWIQGHHLSTAIDPITGRRIVGDLPLLIVDDEADHASVDTGEQMRDADGVPDDNYQPKTINSLIRKILNSFAKSAYVGYTATPFANIFIHHKNKTSEEGEDLFPSAFIKNLAAPSNYVGPAKVFGRRVLEGRENGLPLTRTFTDASISDEEGWMPPKHKISHIPIHHGQEALPDSLKEAIHAFILATCARACRGQGHQHSSMLIHVTRYNNVQTKVNGQVNDYLKKIRNRIVNKTDDLKIKSDLERFWLDDFVKTTNDINLQNSDPSEIGQIVEWSAIEKCLPEILKQISVRKITGKSTDTIDFVENSDVGLKVIVIGGEKLSRGLTLEGLCTSYFVRTTKMYDTLMQMGRWFGYRPGYLDLCRLYTTTDLIEWFGHIADASEELREEFDSMAASHATPTDYGLKVESHPVMTVTSPLKMRSAKPIKLSYSGSMVQTITFINSQDVLFGNLEATQNLIERMGDPSVKHPDLRQGNRKDHWSRSYLWKGVDSKNIISFLQSYTTPENPRVHSKIIAEFIEKMNATGGGFLTSWNVALLAEGQQNDAFEFSKSVSICSFPSRQTKGAKDLYQIGVLTDPSDESIDIDYSEWSQALLATQSEWSSDPARGRTTQVPERPSGKQLRKLRCSKASNPESSVGLLMLYPLLYSGAGKSVPDDWHDPIMGFAISFPESDVGVKVTYIGNPVLWEQEYGPSE